MTLRERARRRLDRPEVVDAEGWARDVEQARKRGFRLVRLPGLTVSIRDYSLLPADSPLAVGTE
jgi:hypothetical protein